jgi:hypothetical protein
MIVAGACALGRIVLQMRKIDRRAVSSIVSLIMSSDRRAVRPCRQADGGPHEVADNMELFPLTRVFKVRSGRM